MSRRLARVGERVQARRKRGIVWAEARLPDLHRALEQRHCTGRPARLLVQAADDEQRLAEIGRRRIRPLAQGQCLLRQRHGLVERTEALVRLRHHQQQRRLNIRLVLQLGRDRGRAGVEELACRHGAPSGPNRVRALEHPAEKRRRRSRSRGLRPRVIALGAGDTRLPQRRCERRDHECRRETGGGKHDLVARDELARDITERRTARVDRLAVEPSRDVPRQRVRRRIPLGGILAQRLQDDRVEVALQRAAPVVRGPVPRRRARVARPDRVSRRPRSSSPRRAACRRSRTGARRPAARRGRHRGHTRPRPS